MTLSDQFAPSFGAPAQSYPASSVAPVPPPVHAVPAEGVSAKSTTSAAVLTWFLGSWGVNNFYLGQTNRGLFKLGLMVCGWIVTIFGVYFLIQTLLESDYSYSYSSEYYSYSETRWNFGNMIPLVIGVGMITAASTWRMAEFFMTVGRNGDYSRDAQGLSLR
ncbi:NINE protein [uncultured Corynebacterium sp.]|uniref:NINE protein n=1 Tax=uncultured Corynebacterium sp. TaxID=159447 RepID=UPI0025CF1D4B|nr:NINE protein [uncultured Corynebacterium sp.]